MKLALPLFAAILIAGATPVRAQTLPFYDVDGQWLECLVTAGAAVHRSAEGVSAEAMAELGRLYCDAHRKEGWFIRDHLATEWDSYNSGKRQLCVDDRNITTYGALSDCLDAKDRR
jgi:hypothetical protein